MKCVIKKVIIKVDIDEYIEGLLKNKGFVDGSDCSLSPNLIRFVDEYDTLYDAEKEVDDTVYIDIDKTYVTIMYEYIDGSESVYFNKVEFKGKKYPIDENFYSSRCYYAIVDYLGI